MYEGIRRLLPLLSDAADRGDLRMVAMSGHRSTGMPIWKFLGTCNIYSKKGYWKRTVVPLVESEYNGFGLKLATQRYIKPHEVKTTRTGAEPDELISDELNPDATNTVTKPVRLYHAGKRLIKGASMKARAHSPKDENGKRICWDFNPHAGCFRGPTCTNSHVWLKPGPVRRCLHAELIRSGGNIRSGKLIPPQDIDVVIRQL